MLRNSSSYLVDVTFQTLKMKKPPSFFLNVRNHTAVQAINWGQNNLSNAEVDFHFLQYVRLAVLRNPPGAEYLRIVRKMRILRKLLKNALMSWQKNKGNSQNCQQSTNPASPDTLKLASPRL